MVEEVKSAAQIKAPEGYIYEPVTGTFIPAPPKVKQYRITPGYALVTKDGKAKVIDYKDLRVHKEAGWKEEAALPPKGEVPPPEEKEVQEGDPLGFLRSLWEGYKERVEKARKQLGEIEAAAPITIGGVTTTATLPSPIPVGPVAAGLTAAGLVAAVVNLVREYQTSHRRPLTKEDIIISDPTGKPIAAEDIIIKDPAGRQATFEGIIEGIILGDPFAPKGVELEHGTLSYPYGPGLKIEDIVIADPIGGVQEAKDLYLASTATADVAERVQDVGRTELMESPFTREGWELFEEALKEANRNKLERALSSIEVSSGSDISGELRRLSDDYLRNRALLEEAKRAYVESMSTPPSQLPGGEVVYIQGVNPNELKYADISFDPLSGNTTVKQSEVDKKGEVTTVVYEDKRPEVYGIQPKIRRVEPTYGLEHELEVPSTEALPPVRAHPKVVIQPRITTQPTVETKVETEERIRPRAKTAERVATRPGIPSPAPPAVWAHPRKREGVEQLTARDLRGAVTWRQGLLWIVVVPPYTEDDVYTTDAPPPYASRIESGTPRQTLSELESGGEPPPDVTFTIPWGLYNITYRNGRLIYSQSGVTTPRPKPPEGELLEDIRKAKRSRARPKLPPTGGSITLRKPDLQPPSLMSPRL